MHKKFIFALLIFHYFSFLSQGQTIIIDQNYLDRSDYKHAIPLFSKIAEKAKHENQLSLFVTAQNGLADCYIDLGSYYISLQILEDNISALNKAKSTDYALYAATHLLLAQNYDNLFLLDEYLKQINYYYYYIKKAYPKKEIYKALYYSYLGRYHSLRRLASQATYYTTNALKINIKTLKTLP